MPRKPTRAPLDFDAVAAIACALPGVEVSTSYGTPALKVKGKLVARMRPEAEPLLVLRCEFVDRAMLEQAAPDTFFVTDHYREHPYVLVRLDRVRRDALPELLRAAWRAVAPKKLLQSLE